MNSSQAVYRCLSLNHIISAMLLQVKPCVVRLPCARSHVMKRMQLSRQTARGFDPKFEGRMVGDVSAPPLISLLHEW